MRVICVDDERIILEDTVALCLELPQIDEAKGFTRAADALLWLEDNDADLALLDIDMPGMNGIELAAAIKRKRPETAILFLTGYSEYAVEAFAVRASGYLMKPVTREKLAEDVAYALSGKKKTPAGHIVIKTFGSFDVFVDNRPVSFRMAKCKELLAYLVDKQGGSVTRAEAFAAVWEDRPYDRGMQKQLDVYIRSLRATLRENGIEEILDMHRGTLRIVPERFVCDAYLFFKGDGDTVNSYRGQYMSAYSWASMTESLMSWSQTENT